jgi:hypothetical protein
MSQKPVQGAKKGGGAPNPFHFDPAETQTPAAAPAPAPRPSRPHLVEYLLLLVGFSLSVYLAREGPLPVEARDFVADPRLRTLVSYLSDVMRLPEGVILVGPILLAIQFLLGRRQGLTSIGWLWLFSWLGVAVLTGLTAWKNTLGFPDPVQQPYFAWIPWVPCLWYAILATTMAVVAVVLNVFSLFSRRPAPWTHTFGAALLLWSGLLAGLVIAVARFKP